MKSISFDFILTHCITNAIKRFETWRIIYRFPHYTGKYRGAAHSIFNLKYSIPREIPVLFHNGSNHG